MQYQTVQKTSWMYCFYGRAIRLSNPKIGRVRLEAAVGATLYIDCNSGPFDILLGVCVLIAHLFNIPQGFGWPELADIRKRLNALRLPHA
jgi:hypothetical protein